MEFGRAVGAGLSTVFNADLASDGEGLIAVMGKSKAGLIGFTQFSLDKDPISQSYDLKSTTARTQQKSKLLERYIVSGMKNQLPAFQTHDASLAEFQQCLAWLNKHQNYLDQLLDQHLDDSKILEK